MKKEVQQRFLQILQDMDESVVETYLTIGESLAEQFPRRALTPELSVIYNQKPQEKPTRAPLQEGILSMSLKKKCDQQRLILNA